MKTEKTKKSTIQLIINELMTGDHLRSKDISDRISGSGEKQVKVQDVASMLSRISNAQKCDLGYFINKTPEGNGFIYNLVEEFLMLSKEQAYKMTLKGKARYSLEKAIEDFPGLEKYTKKSVRKPRKRRARKTIRPSEPMPVKAPSVTPREETVRPPEKMTAKAVEPALSESRSLLEQLEKIAERLREISDLKDVNVNVKVSFKFEGFGK